MTLLARLVSGSTRTAMKGTNRYNMLFTRTRSTNPSSVYKKYDSGLDISKMKEVNQDPTPLVFAGPWYKTAGYAAAGLVLVSVWPLYVLWDARNRAKERLESEGWTPEDQAELKKALEA
eukprot:TRINITY_DN11779_c0_g1_i1.p1 TRINITY_DN11779_c0_g1~~TRINITY_DN11779_c0_g1_i1.p1  ORF type:complete len:119 (+),score=11.48 TRINITY_DN11779_c0_g1_i1:174-530(+)